MFALRAAHCAFILLLIPLSMLSMDTSKKITAAPLCGSQETVWHATFAGDGQEIRPTVVLSTNFLFNTQDMRYVNAHDHLQGKKKKEEDNDNSKRTPLHAELVRMGRKSGRTSVEDNCEHFLTDSHEIMLPAHNTVGDIILKNLSNQKTHCIPPAEDNITRHTPWCAINVAPEKPIVITTNGFFFNRGLHFADHLANNTSFLPIPSHARALNGNILSINASPGSQPIRKIAVASREHTLIDGKKGEQVFAYLVNVTHSDSGELKLGLQENFLIALEAHESLAGLGWTTNGDKLVVLRKQGKRRIASAPDLILETYSAISGKRITCANMPITSSGLLEQTTELSNDHSLLITGNTLATTPRPFVLENTIHDMKEQFPAKDLPRASASSIISLLRGRELTGSRIAYHRSATQQAIEPVAQK